MAKSATCLSGILRRLLCNGGLPTHPSNQFIGSNAEEKVCDQKKFEKLPKQDYKEDAEISKTPGVVARLMGLESLPATPLSARNRTLGSYIRSRSVNSIDFSSQFDLSKKVQYQHRRVRTSVSIGEGLDHEYGFVRHGLNQVADETEELLLVKKRPKMKIQKDKGIKSQFNDKLQERNVNNKPQNWGVGNAACKNDFYGKTRVNLKERRPINKQVDCKEALVGPKYYVKKKKKRIKKQSLTQSARSDHPLRGPKKVHLKSAAITTGAYVSYSSGRKMKNDENCYYKRMVETICSVTKEDLEEKWKQGNLEEICQQLGQEILQVLLKQIVDELLLLHYGTRALLQTS